MAQARRTRPGRPCCSRRERDRLVQRAFVDCSGELFYPGHERNLDVCFDRPDQRHRPTGTAADRSAGHRQAALVVTERLVTAGKPGANRRVAGLAVLTFSAPLDPATAQNAASYTVTQQTKNGRAKAAKAIRLRAVYNHASNIVRLTLAGKPRFIAGGQLVVIGSNPRGITSSSGMHLEGNTGTGPGADGLYTILPQASGIAAR